MSLINKMLQDLDARGDGAASAVHQPEVKAVPAVERDRRPLIYGGAALAVLVAAAGGWYAWQSHGAGAGPVPKVMTNRAPDKPRFQQPPAAATPITPAAAAVEAPAAHDAPAGTAVEAHQAAPAATNAPPAAPAPQVGPEEHEATPAPVAAKPRKAGRVAAPASEAAVPTGAGDGVVITPKQVSENAYRRALLALQEGRTSAALADLDKAVEVDPRNDAARQTYVSLLLENRRTDDAIYQLRLALGIDPRQPGLAMVLARLQLEKGGPAALETLQNTLPYAGANADYLGFLAGVLQRDQRHGEAAERYRDALALAPNNGVWWMGLGISLQADQHLPEAREAYKRARATPGLSAELKTFVDRKIDQLSR